MTRIANLGDEDDEPSRRVSLSATTAASDPCPPGKDVMSIRPIGATLSAVLFLALFVNIPGLFGSLLALLVILSSPLWLVIALYMIGRSLFRRRWRGAVSLFLAMGLPILLWQPILWCAACLHLILTVSFGLGEIGSGFVSNDGRFSAHDWSVGLATSPPIFLIHDATDRIARPGESRYGFDCTSGVRRIIGHYYLCSL